MPRASVAFRSLGPRSSRAAAAFCVTEAGRSRRLARRCANDARRALELGFAEWKVRRARDRLLEAALYCAQARQFTRRAPKALP